METNINEIRERLMRTKRTGLRMRLAAVAGVPLHGYRSIPQTLASGGLRTRAW